MELSLNDKKQSWLEKSLSYFILVCIGVTAMLATGCTNRYGSSGLNTAPLVNTSSWNTSTTTGFATSAYNCPWTANVMPDYDPNDNGTDQYTVCPSNSNTSDILVNGNTETSQDFCVIPADYVDSENVYVIGNTSTNLPWYKCAPVTSGGADLSFPELNFNYVYIVESQNLQSMIECLISGNSITCPDYSAGKFR